MGNEAYIVAARRTAGGRKGGRLKDWHPIDLAAHVLDDLLDRSGADPALIDDVIMGCVTQAGEQSFNIARGAVLASRLPEETPATTVDRQCGSSQQALHFAAQAVISGAMDVVIAAGVESMTRAPMGMATTLPAAHGFGQPRSPRIEARYPGRPFSQFLAAELMVQKYGLTREAMDIYALESHQRAAAATWDGAFEAEITPVEVVGPDGDLRVHRRDEGIRVETTLGQIRALKPLHEGGAVTAATSSQICDGAAGVVVANEAGLKAIGIEPLARIRQMTVVGCDPVLGMDGPITGTRRALAKAGLRLEDIDLFEINEAFACMSLAWLQALGADPARLNVHGGALALGHPLGASGAKLTATLTHALHRRDGRFGLQAMCEGAGQANITIVERL